MSSRIPNNEVGPLTFRQAQRSPLATGNYYDAPSGVQGALANTIQGAANTAVQIVYPSAGSGVSHVISEIHTSMASGTVGTLAYATATLTGSSATAPSDGDTVVIGGKTYTFKTALAATATEGQILIGTTGSTDAAYTNLAKAILQTGTQGTNYWVAQADKNVTTAGEASHNLVLTAKRPGSDGNLITTTTAGSAPGSFGAGTMASGAGPTVSVIDNGLVSAASDGVVWFESLAAAGQDKFAFAKPLVLTPGAQVTVRVSAAGSGVITSLNVPGKYTQ